MSLDFSQQVDHSLELVKRLKNALLPRIDDSEIIIHHEEGLHYIELGEYTITPVEGNRKTVGGSRPVIEWRLTLYEQNNGGYDTPPDVDEIDYGTFSYVHDCVLKIAENELKQKASSIVDSYLWEQHNREEKEMWEDMENNPPQVSQKCIHNENFEDCNECMILADFAIDSKRERS